MDFTGCVVLALGIGFFALVYLGIKGIPNDDEYRPRPAKRPDAKRDAVAIKFYWGGYVD